ncbi:MAG: methionyl-tRNA formyltransferase [Syntrophorhabdaceae bacterium]|nr:methionyl-tRNA formyltransferase [Syntrophorhabdaceae bacterium]
MNIVFFGSSIFSVPILEGIAMYNPYVVTKRPKPKGRGYSMEDNEVKKAALRLGLKYLEIDSFKEEAAGSLKNTTIDLFVVASFGLIFPKWALELPKLGPINVHPSLLPKYRGPSPIQSAILNGEKKTGITIMRITEKVDSGNILYQEEVVIDEEDNGETLADKISRRAASIVKDMIDKIEKEGLPEGKAQNEEEATYTPIITKEMGRIDWDSNANEILRKIRAFIPWPTAYTYLDGHQLKIYGATVIGQQPQGDYPPGLIFGKGREGFYVSTKDGALLVKEIQVENKKRMGAADFANGYRGLVGKILG